MDEIEMLTNKHLAVEVQCYGEVGSDDQPVGIIKLLLHNNFI